MFDPVPWLVGGGAQHSPEVSRTMVYAASGGSEGVVGPGDLKVVPLASPGAGVRALVGSCLVLNRASGGSQQTYAGRNPTATQADVASTSSSGGRSDLIVARVEDPFVAGSPHQAPSDPRVGPYIFVRTIPNVPAGTRRLQDIAQYAGSTAITLARVDLPANTSTVTAAMITDLRQMAQPRSGRELKVDIALPQGGRQDSTTESQFPTNTFEVDVPSWATHFVGIVGINQFLQTGGSEAVAFRAFLGNIASAYTVADLDTAVSAAQRGSAQIAIADVIPETMRGTRQVVKVQSKRQSTAEPGRYSIDISTQITFDLQFREQLT